MKSTTLILFLIVSNLSISQQIDTPKFGKVINSKSNEPVAFTYVKGINSHIHYMCNENGVFSFSEEFGDTLQFLHVSYFSKFESIKSQRNDTVIFKLKERENKLNEIVIIPDYQSFKKSILAMETKQEKHPIHIPGVRIATEPASPKKTSAVSNPITFIATKLSKKEKEKKLYQQLVNEQWDIYYEKLSDDLISKATKLKEKAKIEDFKRFCKLHKEFVINNSEYEIILALKECYSKYVNSKN